jgi:GlpG protein
MIATFPTSPLSQRFLSYLERNNIDARLEANFDAATGHIAYEVWILSEDQLPQAKEALSQFEKEPHHDKFRLQIRGNEEPPRPPKATPLTVLFIALCTLLFFLPLFSPSSSRVFSPLEASLLYDLPPPIEQLQKGEDLTLLPYFHGYFPSLLGLQQGTGPLFIKIRQGELWRLFTPALLHAGLLHILFNMLWVWILGRPIEQRIGLFRYLGLTVVIGIISNTAQYLMTGPLFLGYSGIIVGLAGYIWSRSSIAPWEGYPIPPSTFLFLFLFVGAMALFQGFALFFPFLSTFTFANTAHIVGGLTGIIIGRIRR